jgi:hypothetical protein
VIPTFCSCIHFNAQHVPLLTLLKGAQLAFVIAGSAEGSDALQLPESLQSLSLKMSKAADGGGLMSKLIQNTANSALQKEIPIQHGVPSSTSRGAASQQIDVTQSFSERLKAVEENVKSVADTCAQLLVGQEQILQRLNHVQPSPR